MRFNCGPCIEDRIKQKIIKRKERLKQWHKKFLWFPKRIDNQCIWLETIERKFEWKWSPHIMGGLS